ncbi:LysR family transcriptional regulator [Streptomyces sp. NPDC091271]|uniref:LysR family transcriptional regulator n=1 Tax=Streptomyces sp. NPDC091271 TaxID=3365980 RepID=UPI00381A06A3
MDLRSIDLNLLVALDALLKERGVSRAAQRLALSQPTLSASLARLRRHFNDELLHRVGNQYVLTPLAERLAAMTGDTLNGAERIFTSQASFDPATSQRLFTLLTTDYGLAEAASAVCSAIEREGPRMRVRLRHITPEFAERGAEGLRSVDGLLMPHGYLPDLPHLDLYQDRWVCVVSADNAQVGDELTMHDLVTLPWVDAFGGPGGSTPAARQLRLLGVEPTVMVFADSFLGVPFLVAGTNRAALLQERVARRIADRPDLRTLECPFDAVPLTEAFWWHPVYTHDLEHVWLRGLLTEMFPQPAQ